MVRVYTAPALQDGSAAAYRLLRCAFEGWTGRALPEILRTPAGKPFFEDGALSFSLSHTKTLVVCALSDAGPVGCDAETLRPLRPGLEQRVLTQAEQRWLRDQPTRDVALLTLWTKKEALVKLTGQGLAGRPRAVETATAAAAFSTRRVADCIVTVCTPPPLPAIEW